MIRLSCKPPFISIARRLVRGRKDWPRRARTNCSFLRPFPAGCWSSGRVCPNRPRTSDLCYRFLTELSRKLGHVQFFSASRVVNYHCWALMEKGPCLSRLRLGGRNVMEPGAGHGGGAGPGPDLLWIWRGAEFLRHSRSVAVNSDNVNQLAARWSVDPCACSPAMSNGRGIVGRILPIQTALNSLRTPETCPTCGADVPKGAKACPECGADEHTGWSEEAYASSLGLPDDSFDYDDFVKREFDADKISRAARDSLVLVGRGDCRRDRLCRRLLLQIVEVILDRSLVSARHLVLVKRALGVALRRRRRFLIADGTLPLDADSLESDARHRPAGTDLAMQFCRRQIVRQLRVAAICQAARVRVRAIERRCCPTNRSSWDTIANRHRSMCRRPGLPDLCQGADNGRPPGTGRCNRRNSGTRPISNGRPRPFPLCSQHPANLRRPWRPPFAP